MQPLDESATIEARPLLTMPQRATLLALRRVLISALKLIDELLKA